MVKDSESVHASVLEKDDAKETSIDQKLSSQG